MDINDVFEVINTEKAAALCLSRGGWEGWLQCELWGYLSIEKKIEVEREVPYPRSREKCDLVVRSTDRDLWVELKACGLFREGDINRFLDAVAVDVHKIGNRPMNTNGRVLVVVPKAMLGEIHQHGWNGFEKAEGRYAFVFYRDI